MKELATVIQDGQNFIWRIANILIVTTFVILVLPVPASAQCATAYPGGDCASSKYWCTNTASLCFAAPTVPTNASWSCGSCYPNGTGQTPIAFKPVCNGGYIDCTPNTTTTSCVQNTCTGGKVATCTNATTISCACGANTIECNGNCRSTTSPTCQSPKVWNACAQTCNDPTVYLSPATLNPTIAEPQSGYITVTGNIRSGADILLSSGKSIHVGDVAAGALFNIGNWGTGGTADGDRLTVNFFSGMLVAGVRNPDYVAFPDTSPTPAYKSGAIKLGVDENLYFGAVQDDSHIESTLLLLQVATNGSNATYSDRLRLNPFGQLTLTADATVVGNVFDIKVGNTSVFSVDKTGTVTAAGGAIGGGGGGACSGRMLKGFTVASTGKAVSGGITGGYDTADALCETARAAAGSTDSVGSWKVCSAEEVLNSYKCTAAGDSSYIRQTAADGPAWINAGPPGYVAWSNDCNAWQNDAPTGSSPNIITYFGRVWQFNKQAGGKPYGTLTVCTANLRYACCK